MRRSDTRRRPTTQTMPAWQMYGLAAFFVFSTGLAAVLIFSAVRNFVASAAVPGDSGLVFGGDGAPSASGGGNDGGGGSGAVDGDGPAGVSDIPFQPWVGTDRVTVLLMGIDQRAGIETETAYRTDSMMLLTLDPVANTAGILSIPRDLWVTIPGFEEKDRINTANFRGDAYRLPGGGPQLAMTTVEYNLGIHVDYYVRINFTAFETLIDEIGGIEVDVLETIDDPEYPDCCYGYDPFYLEAGRQTLNGADALKYARTRHTTGGDFDRAFRQQQVILAVRDKLLSINNLPALLARAPNLYSTLAGSYDTNLTLEQIIALGLKAQDVARENITTAVIDNNYIQEFYTTADGAQVLLLNADAFRELRDSMFYTPTQPGLPSANLIDLVVAEGATLAVQNGSGRDGQAAEVANYLTAQGVPVSVIDTAPGLYANTLIYTHRSSPYLTRWLVENLALPSTSLIAQEDQAAATDVVLILGSDFALP